MSNENERPDQHVPHSPSCAAPAGVHALCPLKGDRCGECSHIERDRCKSSDGWAEYQALLMALPHPDELPARICSALNDIGVYLAPFKPDRPEGPK